MSDLTGKRKVAQWLLNAGDVSFFQFQSQSQPRFSAGEPIIFADSAYSSRHQIVLNSVGFLRITRYHHDTQKHGMEDVNGPDSLGDTRIQFADYELARKMATDALELDEEDIHDEHPFHAVSLIMNDHDRERKLMELDLDEFAISRYEANQDQKRHTLSLIRDELLRPFADMRQCPGSLILADLDDAYKQFVAVKLESGIEGIVNAQYTANIPDDPHKLVKKGQMVPSVIIDIKFDLDQDHVFVELSIREKELLMADKDNLERKKRQQSSGSQRVIKHSNFHDFNASQAEVYLEKQQRGDAGIRPSSRGREHLAGHLGDVTDRNPDPTGQSVGNQLVIEANHVYSDLDKLVVNHAQAMSRKVELERMVRDGFIADEDEDEDDDEDEEKEKERRRRHNTESAKNLWDDDKRDDGDGGGMNMESFIEYSDEEDGQEGREERRRVQKQDAERRRRAGGGGRLQSLQALTSTLGTSFTTCLGGGEDYNWALELDDEEEQEDYLKQDMKYQDIFETSEIQRRFLTDDDELVRARDIPERMQLASSSLSQSFSLALYGAMNEEDPGGAAMWPLESHPFMAVTFALKCLFVGQYEVPYVWVHKRDFMAHFDPNDSELLDLTELWPILGLGQKYRSLIERRKALSSLSSRLHAPDEYFESDILFQKDKNRDVITEFRLHNNEEQPREVKKHKMPSRVSAYEMAKKSIASKLAEVCIWHCTTLSSSELLRWWTSARYVEYRELHPVAFAKQYVDPNPSKAQSPEQLLGRACMILATEFGKDPLLRKDVRKFFQEEALISVEPTERGTTKIDDHHSYNSSQWLLILAAGAEHLVTVSIFLPPAAVERFEKRLSDAFLSESFSDLAKGWNEERNQAVRKAIQKHLAPVGVKWTRECLREEVEEFLGLKCSNRSHKRIDVAPYLRRRLGEGDYASSVLAVSWGKGDHHKDPISMVSLYSAGRLCTQAKIDNLHDTEGLDKFHDLVTSKKPDLIAVGDFAMSTMKLVVNPEYQIPAHYVLDNVARIYHRARAAEEFGSLSLNAKYCVGLARYIQSPLNDFAALGSDITAIAFEEEDQHLVPKEKLALAFEHVLADVTDAMSDSYYNTPRA
ncbi:hypothetical protein BKA70DRAFT_1440796 [Coprinopsis sp. MPI-PUGE-AT-0042]|nr:hypothetical protein BKA70DRAFT_1440796 [Coprinopsis sp. MPI-PUGE-AT-0042]